MFRLVLTILYFVNGPINCEMPLLSKSVTSMIEEGKRQYNLVKAKSTMPALGSCWKVAVTHLHDGCKHLDDTVQSDLALGFANCFIEGAGLQKYECSGAISKELCLKSMPDRAFLAYTEFFTHTQSMCFFIMSQVWHEETEETIDRLSVSASDVVRQLEASEELQVELLKHQRQSVVVQEKLLENGRSLGHMLLESRDSIDLIFSEFRSATLEQQRLLGMVFHHLSALQSWVVGEVSWLDSIAFYVPSFAVVFFVTSAQRSASARIPSCILLILAAFVERFVANVLLTSDADPNNFQPIEVLKEQLNWWIWLIRRSSVGAIFLLLGVILYRYHDREEIIYQLLQRIQTQNEELLKYINLQKTQVALRQPKVDEVDGIGYIAIPNISPSTSHSYRASRHNSSSLSSSGHIVSTSERESHSVILEDHKSEATLISPLQPLQNGSMLNISEDIVVPVTQDDSSTYSIKYTSTPKKKLTLKPSNDHSPVSPRYNLRRGRQSALSS